MLVKGQEEALLYLLENEEEFLFDRDTDSVLWNPAHRAVFNTIEEEFSGNIKEASTRLADAYSSYKDRSDDLHDLWRGENDKTTLPDFVQEAMEESNLSNKLMQEDSSIRGIMDDDISNNHDGVYEMIGHLRSIEDSLDKLFQYSLRRKECLSAEMNKASKDGYEFAQEEIQKRIVSLNSREDLLDAASTCYKHAQKALIDLTKNLEKSHPVDASRQALRDDISGKQGVTDSLPKPIGQETKKPPRPNVSF